MSRPLARRTINGCGGAGTPSSAAEVAMTRSGASVTTYFTRRRDNCEAATTSSSERKKRAVSTDPGRLWCEVPPTMGCPLRRASAGEIHHGARTPPRVWVSRNRAVCSSRAASSTFSCCRARSAGAGKSRASQARATGQRLTRNTMPMIHGLRNGASIHGSAREKIAACQGFQRACHPVRAVTTTRSRRTMSARGSRRRK